LLSKNNFARKTSKRDMMISYMLVWHCVCTYCTNKIHLLHFSIIVSLSALYREQQCWKQDQKYKTKTKTEASLRPSLS